MSESESVKLKNGGQKTENRSDNSTKPFIINSHTDRLSEAEDNVAVSPAADDHMGAVNSIGCRESTSPRKQQDLTRPTPISSPPIFFSGVPAESNDVNNSVTNTESSSRTTPIPATRTTSIIPTKPAASPPAEMYITSNNRYSSHQNNTNHRLPPVSVPPKLTKNRNSNFVLNKSNSKKSIVPKSTINSNDSSYFGNNSNSSWHNSNSNNNSSYVAQKLVDYDLRAMVVSSGNSEDDEQEDNEEQEDGFMLPGGRNGAVISAANQGLLPDRPEGVDDESHERDRLVVVTSTCGSGNPASMGPSSTTTTTMKTFGNFFGTTRSRSRDKYPKRSSVGSRGDRRNTEGGSRSKNFFADFDGVLNLLGVFGLYPGCQRKGFDVTGSSTPSSCNNGSSIGSLWMIRGSCFWLSAVLYLIGSIGLFGFNAYIMNFYRVHMGMMHFDTMTQILTGIKPLQTTLNLLVFILGIRAHRQLLHSLSVTDYLFRENFHAAPNYPALRESIGIFTGLSGLLPFILRLVQFILSGERLGAFWLADASLIFLPIVSILQLLPLIYFVQINRMIRFWYESLKREMERDIRLCKHDIDFYYSHYLKLCSTLWHMGGFFNPFIFFSLAFSVVILCLTIYFVINAQTSLKIPENVDTQGYWVIIFLPIWAGIQIITAFFYIVLILLTGIKTNEQARNILQTVLTLIPTNEVARFQLLCFTCKVQTQYSWGVTVWRAFPIERGLLLTLISGIITYTVILMKLQRDRGNVQLSEASELQTFILNGTLN